MSEKRIIPCLDIMDGKVVKGVNFENLADIGDPVEIAKRYEQQYADEIVFLDINATHEGRETNRALFARAARELSIPLIVGGGVRTTGDFRRIFSCGVKKVSINSSAVENPTLISEASAVFGKRRVIVAIDGKKVGNDFKVFVKGGRENTGLDLVEWAKKCEHLGAGEILLTSMDADGTKRGYDIAMTTAVVSSVSIPVIASGGCGSIDDIIGVFRRTGCDAVLVASLFHYGIAAVNEVKLEMERNGIPCLI